MKKIITLLLVIIMCTFNLFSLNAATLGTKKLGIAMDIIDGEALVVKFGDSNIFIKLIGINTNASEEAIQYMNTNVKGKYVYVETEDIYSGDVPDTKYYYAYVYMKDTGEMLNSILLKKGLADLKTSNSNAIRYSELSTAQTYAKSKKVGVWNVSKTTNYSNSKNNYTYSGNGVNINTASSSQLTKLTSVNSNLASNIISYRNQNPFNTIEEIKFVTGMTKEIFDDIYDEITVITNINSADENELLTLTGMNQSKVDSIIKYRERSGNFTGLDQFYRETNLSSSDYETNKHFISLDYSGIVDYTIGSTVVNINTASSSQIKSASSNILSSSEADAIVSNRRKSYGYKTLMELCKLSGSSISIDDINKLEDNFNLYTDINNATTSELESLFGNSYSSSEVNKIKNQRPFNSASEIRDIIGSSKYDDIKEYIYVDTYDVPERVNLNLASKSQLEDLDVSSSEVSQLSNKRKSITYSSQLPFDVNNINDEVSLYTNINTATEYELQTLYNMPSSLVNSIIDYRNDQPFGSMTEIREFFSDESESSIYSYISNFIVFR